MGVWLDHLTQRWVRLTGTRVDFANEPWLDGPVGRSDMIGTTWLDDYVTKTGASVDDRPGAGLLESMGELEGPDFKPVLLHTLVRDFYETTSEWDLDVWARWSPWLRPGGVLMRALFSRRLQQLNLPLDPLDASRGMSSEVTQLIGADGRRPGASWQRTLRATGDTVFGGFYGVVALPREAGPTIRVVFPLPNGSLIVFLRPENGPSGSLRLVSKDGRWGGAGAYLVVVDDTGASGWARRVPLPEVFDVYVDDEGTLRADHDLRLRRRQIIQIHYRMRPSIANRNEPPARIVS